ncbi:pyridoxamine 5'-phosphate oxidase family protein [Affinibrenneria salicis]|uniref:Pyridoxamine 5'-phosphate oxidase family protein n=1 Tax=Affinibrenneria salicis TaxID=2590031 RepID=A0A5J5G1H6_9GAMM|nr:pyridoxamine 5'-phosphate oxidase family protein [Affinibrenneria salicis]KAA9000498.1 pyridoxamine 5'-phosphate oxidase family protein [Affinibrenneria salicis]
MHSMNVAGAHPHGEMRRDEREITDRAEIDRILAGGKVMYLALADDNVPFLVPVFYAWDGESLYFHSARSGSKIAIMQRNNKVCFAVSLDQGVIEDALACNFEARHRTAIGLGETQFVEDEQAKIRALDAIVKRFTDQRFTYPKENLKATRVIRIDIVSIKGKKHGI